MPECPECHKEIDHLVNWCDKSIPYCAYVVNGEVEYGPGDLREAVCLDGQEYDCPECEATLFYLEYEAEEFLLREGAV